MKYPIYQVKVSYIPDEVNWEARPLWDETTGHLSLAEVASLSLDYLKKHHPTAKEIRVNEKGSYQGHYFTVR